MSDDDGPEARESERGEKGGITTERAEAIMQRGGSEYKRLGRRGDERDQRGRGGHGWQRGEGEFEGQRGIGGYDLQRGRVGHESQRAKVGYKQQRDRSSRGTQRERIGLDGKNIKQLQDLLQKDPSTIVLTLIQHSGIAKFLEDEVIDPAKMLMVVSLLAKALGCTTTREYVNQVLLAVHNSSFYDQVSAVFAEMDTSFTVEERIQFISGILSYLKELFTRLPHSFLELKVLTFESLLKEEIKYTEIYKKDGEQRERFAELQYLKVTVQENIEEKQRENDRSKDEEPPDSFREISILPTKEDMQIDERPFLRKNKARGGYTDLNHYLDVQFRLLREDFIAPLREGINQYILSEGSVKGKRQTDIRVYNEVHVMKTVCAQAGLLHRLRFDVSRFTKVKWENSKRLIFGSLLCLSDDNFKTFFLATVSDRDINLLKQGYIDVLIESKETFKSDSKYVMVETTAFFEAYRHVLRGLQMVTEGNLPFEKYIVFCYSVVKPPNYLEDKPLVKYDLRPLVDEDNVLREDAALVRQGREVSYAFSQESQQVENLNIFQNQNWPKAELFHTDESQKKALKTALTKEFTIIQGPPGTGKTYVGLKIVKALLHNSKVWNSTRKSPMLIVCYTNHALDQFLLGIISFFNGSVIRVGTKITNNELQKYSLKVHRQKARKSEKSVMKMVRQQRYDLRVTLMTLQYEIEKTGICLEAAETAILHEDCLRPYMQNHYDLMLKTMRKLHWEHQYQMQKEMPFPKSFMNEWLGLGSYEDMLYMLQQPSDMNEGEEEDDEEVIGVLGEAEIEQNQRKIDELDDSDLRESELDVLQRKIDNLKHTKSEYVAFDTSTFDGQTARVGHFEFQKKERKKMKKQLLRKIHSTKRMTNWESLQVYDPWSLPMEERWRLYRYWVHLFCDRLRNRIKQKEILFKMSVSKVNELRLVEDKQIFEDASVIGMTTTAAARYQQILNELGPKIIVVEEAAEVLEGHIITTLSNKCEHLILIGDHKQLKPNPTVYDLARKYNLDLSLFERMVNNGIHCDTLALQHRMRPEISSIIRHIYPHLQDHPCVADYEQVKGISHNMFFIDHKNPEEHDNDLFSHSNEYEAVYIVALCKYLLKQGYNRSRITVLTTYSGQLFKLRKLMPKADFEGVHVTVVDNYQGEENDIILLSLVRSNEAGSVGFLKIENRVCVALSRAKIGLFVIGNIELLAQQSQLWNDIWGNLKENSRIGSTLNLYCQNHVKDDGISVQSPDDFKKAPEGGCLKPCEFRLDCDHVCQLCCHPYDRCHIDYKCTLPCEMEMPCGKHQCIKRCFQECGECMVLVEKVMPTCGHIQMVPCSMSPDEVSCRKPCEVTLKCGHPCGNECWEEHKCKEKVTKTFRCGHNEDVFCERKDEVECQTKCSQILKCGHICIGKCSTCHEGRLHSSCNKKCEKILVCSHKCEGSCSTCPPCMKACENRCLHNKCTNYCHEVCKPCKEPCWWKCKHYKCTRSCGEPCDRPPCNKPCPRTLQCKHPCIGVCGEPCPSQCRICNKDDLIKICSLEEVKVSRFVFLKDCSHIVEVSKLDQYMALPSSKFILKGCPHCKTPIRHHVRYWNAIREVLINVDQVKLQFQKRMTDDKKAKLRRTIDEIEAVVERREKMGLLNRGFTNTMAGLFAIENIMSFHDSLKTILDEYTALEGMMYRADDLENTKQLVREANHFLKFIKKPRLVFTEQEESDSQGEIFRHKAAIKMLKHQFESFQSRSSENMAILKGLLLSGTPFTEDNAQNIKKCIQELIGPRFDAAEIDEQVTTVHFPDLNLECWTTCGGGHVRSRLDGDRCDKCQQKLREDEEERLWFSMEDDEDFELENYLEAIDVY